MTDLVKQYIKHKVDGDEDAAWGTLDCMTEILFWLGEDVLGLAVRLEDGENLGDTGEEICRRYQTAMERVTTEVMG